LFPSAAFGGATETKLGQHCGGYGRRPPDAFCDWKNELPGNG